MGRIIDTEDLENDLLSLMNRRGVKNWTDIEFDAADFQALIDDCPDASINLED